MVRDPRRLRRLQRQIYDAAAELAQRHGRAARPSEIARRLDVDDVVLEGLAYQVANDTASWDEPAWTADEGPDSSDEALAPLLAELPTRERRILLMRFVGGLTQTEIG